MESVQLNNVTDTSESEAEPINIEEESENSVTDIMNLDIKSRLSLATSDTYEEPRTNGMARQGHFNEHDEAKTLSPETDDSNIQYVSYTSELQMPDIMHLIQKDLSEPYSIYTYRYFIHNWPKLCFLAMDGDKCIGAIVCKLDIHRKVIKRGYIAMLAVDVKYRKRKVGSNLVRRAIQAMMEDNADEVVLETEITNSPALRLYENLGFVRDKRLFRYYLNGVDALRLKLWIR
ncbi:N-alpha-acetyltransferase 30 [Halictus rubicundus]|uniref:N-alpha-acetyltransferase 30 n=1 Tax=Halictus rubicundus TaxID=77578 RepID=UPI0040353551